MDSEQLQLSNKGQQRRAAMLPNLQELVTLEQGRRSRLRRTYRVAAGLCICLIATTFIIGALLDRKNSDGASPTKPIDKLIVSRTTDQTGRPSVQPIQNIGNQNNKWMTVQTRTSDSSTVQYFAHTSSSWIIQSSSELNILETQSTPRSGWQFEKVTDMELIQTFADLGTPVGIIVENGSQRLTAEAYSMIQLPQRSKSES